MNSIIWFDHKLTSNVQNIDCGAFEKVLYFAQKIFNIKGCIIATILFAIFVVPYEKDQSVVFVLIMAAIHIIGLYVTNQIIKKCIFRR